jgi:hypothetical protein
MMTKITINSPEEVNTIFREIAEFTIHGLAVDGEKEKQFYLERIYVTLGLPLDEIRKKLGIEKGVSPL